MTVTNFNFHKVEGGTPIKMWTKGVPVEDVALRQLENTSRLPFIYKHLAVMADCHWGKGSTVGSVVATKGAIVPAAVGVDIGCGMMANLTSLTANDLPDNLSALRTEIEAAVPHGRTNDGGPGDRGAWGNPPDRVINAWTGLAPGLVYILGRHPKLKGKHGFRTAEHLGTLGTGNHFVEVCLDEQDRVWVMLHSGSRGLGARIGGYFMERAQEEMRRWHIDKYLPHKDLSYLVENTELFDDYVFAVGFAQDYAARNRHLMMDATMTAIGDALQQVFTWGTMAVNCHHNYVTRENHFGENVLVTRKGAVMAREGVLGIIPGSMGTRSYIVRGKGNPESFHSCSHGAGRRMGRKQAERTITLEDHQKALANVECRKDETTLDETPAAYKDIDAVMAAQTDLVSVEHVLKQVLCVKG